MDAELERVARGRRRHDRDGGCRDGRPLGRRARRPRRPRSCRLAGRPAATPAGLPLRRAAAAPPARLAVAARAAARRPRRRGRLVRVRPDPGRAERPSDGLGAVRRRPAGGARGRRTSSRRGSSRDVHREPHETVEGRRGLRAEPRRRRARRQGRRRRHHVSTGPPKVEVPDVKGKSRDDAVAALAEAKLKVEGRARSSRRRSRTRSSPRTRAGGEMVIQGSTVQINVSKGAPAAHRAERRRPAVRQRRRPAPGPGLRRRAARRRLEPAEGHRHRPAAEGRRRARPRRHGHLYVSKGPKESTIPDVTSLDEASATQTLEQSGFAVDVQEQDTTDPSQDGIVLSQDPPGGTKAKPGTTVTIVVGRLVDDSLMAEAPRRSRHGRPLERARDLARLGALGARGARPGALRDGDGRDRPRRPLGARLRARAASWSATGARRVGDAAGADVAGARDACGRRRRLPGPARALRRGRHRAGAARARGRAVRRRGRRRLGALHGQGPVQVGAARQGDPGHAERDAARARTASRTRSASRCS